MAGVEVYAHSKPRRPIEEWQPLKSHLEAVAEMAAEFAKEFASADWAWNAGHLHDLGKATSAFQSYLRKDAGLDDPEYDQDGSTRNHSSAGAALAFDRLDLPGRVLAYAIAGHHAGLPDWFSNVTGNAALQIRLEEGRANLKTIPQFGETAVHELRKASRPPSFVREESFHLWIRMLFSCLVDADRLDSERFGDPSKAEQRSAYPSIGFLAPKLIQALDALERDAPKSDVNRIRAEIRKACEHAAEQSPGLFSLAVPTGGGKTLSAMAFAMLHALRYGKSRVIYVIPYTSIIEQTANTLAKIFERDNVVEHHSNIEPAHETPRSQLASENWDAPIIVTTNVQFFESLYAARPSRCRKLHNIANSVVILDEAQLIPPKLLNPCVAAINQLVEGYGVTVVLATATQPPLPGLLAPTNIVPQGLDLYEKLRRAEIHLPADLNERASWTELADRLLRHPHVLCVVNTRRDCRELFGKMPSGTIHLSALMCGSHRSEVIAEIKRRIADDEPCRVISTQLIEAGVDLDFPVVYRALAGLDSIAQAAGRCNREGRLNAEGRLGEVHVFTPPQSSPPGLLRKGEDTMREMPHIAGFDPQQPRFFERYFHIFYEKLGETGQHFHELLARDVNPHLRIQFRTAGSEFKIIDDSTQQSVFVRWGGNERWIEELRKIGPTRENLRALQRSAVSLSRMAFQVARNRGEVEELRDGFWLWIGKYDPITGLDAFGDGFAPEEMVT